jgi:branched-chain amino acid transport system substrate-binding protein
MCGKTVWALSLALCAASTGCSDDNGSSGGATIKIGVLAPVTGTLSSDGEQQKRAALLAVEEFNAAGGVLGKQLQLEYADTATDPAMASKAAQELIDKGVVAIIGAVASSVTIKASEATIKAKIPLISPASTSPEITKLKDDSFVWRTLLSDEHQGSVAARYAYDSMGLPGKPTAGVIYIKNAYGESLAGIFKQEFEKLGGTILNFVEYPEMTDVEVQKYTFEKETADLFTGNPDLIYLITYQEGAKITAQAKKYLSATYTPRFFGCDGNYSADFINSADPFVVDGMLGTAIGRSINDGRYNDFAAAYEKRFGVKPIQTSAETYDAMYLVSLAITKAKAGTGAALNAKLKEVSGPPGKAFGPGEFAAGVAEIEGGGEVNFEGASGKIDWDDKGDVTSGTYAIWEVKKVGASYDFVIRETKEVP